MRLYEEDKNSKITDFAVDALGHVYLVGEANVDRAPSSGIIAKLLPSGKLAWIKFV